MVRTCYRIAHVYDTQEACPLRQLARRVARRVDRPLTTGALAVRMSRLLDDRPGSGLHRAYTADDEELVVAALRLNQLGVTRPGAALATLRRGHRPGWLAQLDPPYGSWFFTEERPTMADSRNRLSTTGVLLPVHSDCSCETPEGSVGPLTGPESLVLAGGVGDGPL